MGFFGWEGWMFRLRVSGFGWVMCRLWVVIRIGFLGNLIMLMVMSIVWRWIWGDSIIGMIIIVKIDLILFVKCCMNNVFFIVCNIFFKELFYKFIN